MTGSEYKRRIGRRPDAYRWAAAMLCWFYQVNRRIIRSSDVPRVLKLDETTRRVLLGIATPPGEPPERKRGSGRRWKSLTACGMPKAKTGPIAQNRPERHRVPEMAHFPAKRPKRRRATAKRPSAGVLGAKVEALMMLSETMGKFHSRGRERVSA